MPPNFFRSGSSHPSRTMAVRRGRRHLALDVLSRGPRHLCPGPGPHTFARLLLYQGTHRDVWPADVEEVQ